MLLYGSIAMRPILVFCKTRSAVMSFFIAGVLALVLILVGCGGDTAPSQSPDPDNPTYGGA